MGYCPFEHKVGRARMGVGRVGLGAGHRRARHGEEARGAGRADKARWALGAGARHLSTWACCWASRLCTLCTQLVLTQF